MGNFTADRIFNVENITEVGIFGGHFLLRKFFVKKNYLGGEFSAGDIFYTVVVEFSEESVWERFPNYHVCQSTCNNVSIYLHKII